MRKILFLCSLFFVFSFSLFSANEETYGNVFDNNNQMNLAIGEFEDTYTLEVDMSISCMDLAIAFANNQLENGEITSGQWFGAVLHFLSICSER